MFSWLWRCSLPQEWPSRPTAVGANAPSANRANVRPASAGAEPELADLGRVSFGVHAPFFWEEVSSGGVSLCPQKGRFSSRPAPAPRKMSISIFFRSSRILLICSSRCRSWCSWGWGNKGRLRGNIHCNVFGRARLEPRRAGEGEEG